MTRTALLPVTGGEPVRTGAGPTDSEAFHAYVTARSQALLRTAYLLTGSHADAQDLLQTTLAKTWLAWGRIRDRRALDGYVRRTMINTHTSRWRRRRVHEVVTDTLPEIGGRDAYEAVDEHLALWTALSALTKRQRAMVVLRYYEDLSEADTAAVMGVSVGTVKSTVTRALSTLRQATGPNPSSPTWSPSQSLTSTSPEHSSAPVPNGKEHRDQHPRARRDR